MLVALSLLREGYNKNYIFNICQTMFKLSVEQSGDFSWNNASVRDDVKTKRGKRGRIIPGNELRRDNGVQ